MSIDASEHPDWAGATEYLLQYYRITYGERFFREPLIEVEKLNTGPAWRWRIRVATLSTHTRIVKETYKSAEESCIEILMHLLPCMWVNKTKRVKFIYDKR